MQYWKECTLCVCLVPRHSFTLYRVAGVMEYRFNDKCELICSRSSAYIELIKRCKDKLS